MCLPVNYAYTLSVYVYFKSTPCHCIVIDWIGCVLRLPASIDVFVNDQRLGSKPAAAAVAKPSTIQTVLQPAGPIERLIPSNASCAILRPREFYAHSK